MKSSTRKIVSALVFGGLMLSTLRAGTEVLFYPLARAFGSPRESELARCRQAFQQLQAHWGTSRVLVQPVLFVDGARREWRQDLAESICREAGTLTSAKLEVAGTAPAVAPALFRHNQLRYLWERAAQYTQWAKTARPAGGYVWCAEIWGHDGKVAAIQIYLLDPSGQIAYCRLFNSHQLGKNLPMQGEDAVRLIVRRLFKDLQREAKSVFPPYGIG